MSTVRQNYQLISGIALVLGIVLITAAEMPSMHWTRILGASAISIGALGIGVYIGLSNPGRFATGTAPLSRVRKPIGVVLLILLFLPVVAGLAAGVIGTFNGPAGTGWVVATGGLVLALMLVATVAAFIIGLGVMTGSAWAVAVHEGDDPA